MAADQGLEPQLTAPEAVVLPLDESAKFWRKNRAITLLYSVLLRYWKNQAFSSIMALMLSEPMQKLALALNDLRTIELATQNQKQVFEVNKLISKAATYYEKVRYLVDYQEEHTIRRNALERILKRKIVIEGGEVHGTTLLQELASGQYIDEAQVTEELGRKIDTIMSKFLRLRDSAGLSSAVGKRLLAFAAAEIDYALSLKHYIMDQGITNAFYDTVRKDITLPGVKEDVADLQIYCACYRSLFRPEDESLAYALWMKYIPQWQNATDATIADTAPRLGKILSDIDFAIKNTLQWRLIQKLKNETVYFLIVRELVQQYGAESQRILETPVELEIYTQSLLEKKYVKENARIRSSGIRAVIYLFFTKALFAMALEIPYEMFILTTINYVPIAMNVVFHPLLLLVVTRGVGTFDTKNTGAVLKGMKEVFYEGKTEKIKIRTGKSGLIYIFTTMYVVLLFFVFGAIVAGLKSIHFNSVGIIIFLFFLALVSYFAFRIRYNSKRWKVTQQESALSLILSIFTVPVIRTGRWLSQSFSSINVFVFILDFIIETPFKIVLNFSNQFISYLKEKTPEIY